jgi:hypothetical protein
MIKITRGEADKRPITPDGHHDSASVDAVATALDEVARLLTYETQKGLTHPSDAYTVLGSVYEALYKIPQSLQYVAEFLDRQLATGRMRDNPNYSQFGGNASAAAKVVAAHLATARDLFDQLGAQIREAQNATSGLEAVEDEDD